MPSDEVLFLDMLNAARNIKNFIAGMTETEFINSLLHQSAVIRELLVIGEAARQIPEEVKVSISQIAWRRIIDMRNHLVHRYFRIDLDIVWEVVSEHLDVLISQLITLVPPDDDQS